MQSMMFTVVLFIVVFAGSLCAGFEVGKYRERRRILSWLQSLRPEVFADQRGVVLGLLNLGAPVEPEGDVEVARGGHEPEEEVAEIADILEDEPEVRCAVDLAYRSVIELMRRRKVAGYVCFTHADASTFTMSGGGTDGLVTTTCTEIMTSAAEQIRRELEYGDVQTN